MFTAFPAQMRIYASVENGSDFPISVKDGKTWLAEYSQNHTLYFATFLAINALIFIP